MNPKIIIRGGPPYCPLCDNRMNEVFHLSGHVFYTCAREMCMISVNKNDLCIKQWDTIKKPICQFCHKPMRVFVRKDKLVIMQCRDKSHAMYQVARGDARALPGV